MRTLATLLFCSMLSLHCSLNAQQGTIQLPATGQSASYYPGDDGDLQMGVPIPANRFTDNGNGSITDIFTGLMWAKDANLIATRNPSFDQDRTPGDGDVDWTHALDYVQLLNNENYLGYDDWRLPTVIELLSMIDYSQPHIGLPDGHPFLNIMGGYWSSTTWERFRGMGLTVFLKEYRVHANTNHTPGYLEGFNKDLDIYSPVYYKIYVLPVRDHENTGTINLQQSGQTNNYYSGDDGDLQSGTTWPTARFMDNRNHTVTDRLTGLMWTQDANVMLSRDPDFAGEWGRVVWTDALDYVTKLNDENYLGYSDWRLPNRLEMLSILDLSRSEYALQEGNPFIHAEAQNDSSALVCWTSTTLGRNADSAWSVHLSSGKSSARPKFAETYVWPVRTDNNSLPLGSIQGSIDGIGITGSGVSISIKGPVNARTKTDAAGYFEFSHLPDGSYHVTPTYWYYFFSPDSRTVTVSGSSVTADFTAEFNRAFGWSDISQGLFPLENGAGSNLVGMHFINDDEGWITSSNGIYHTTDGGETFEKQTTMAYCLAVFMLDENEGYAGGTSGWIYHTTNGGDNWQLLNSMGSNCQDISFAPGSAVGFFCGGNGQLWRIGDGVFEQIYTGLVGSLTSVAAMSENEAFFCGTHMWYFNGTTITSLSTPTNTAYSMDMFDDGLGWVVSNSGEINGFVSLEFPWLVLHPPSNVEHLYDIGSPNGKDVWAVGAYGLILHSPNGDDFYINSIPNDWGNNTIWNTQAPGLSNSSLWQVHFTSPVNGYAVGDNGTILKYSLLEGSPEGADILGFAVSQQLGASTVDPENLTVFAEVDPEADLTSLIPELFLSAGASCDPPSGQSQDFTSPVDYVVTSADGNEQKTWTVSISLYTGIGAQPIVPVKQDILIYPNPTRGQFKVQSSKHALNPSSGGEGFKVEFKSVELLDIYGKILETRNSEPGTLELDLSHLPAGIYLVRVSFDNQIFVKKLIKF